jgi:hypothetical protein
MGFGADNRVSSSGSLFAPVMPPPSTTAPAPALAPVEEQKVRKSRREKQEEGEEGVFMT